MKGIFLGHLSRENNYEELAYETVCSEVTLGDNPYKSRDFRFRWHRGIAYQKQLQCRKDKELMKKTIITVVGNDTVGIIAKFVLILQTIM